MVSVPKCVQQWGQFTPDVPTQGSFQIQGHFEAPLPADTDDNLCQALLEALRVLQDCDESEVWEPCLTT